MSALLLTPNFVLFVLLQLKAKKAGFKPAPTFPKYFLRTLRPDRPEPVEGCG